MFQQHPSALRPQSSYQARPQSAAPPIYSNHGSRHSHNHSHTPVPPQGGDPQLFQYFAAVDADRSGSISVSELQQALVNGNWTRFDLDTVKMLMGIFDTDRSGTISFQGERATGGTRDMELIRVISGPEFSGLWKYISDWQNVFRHFDRDGSGSIEGNELASALKSFGYNLSPALLTLIERKYASAPSTMYGPPPGITFDRFVRACVVVKTLTESFQRADNDRDGWINVNYETFMTMVLSAP
ncbi:EF-hand domain-containing protein [Mycena chlorophos]|uniref:EF-hand domain-containing protein n=1 Tax=Mycena chlorophos TaxID=658473 RepID=A0A8H6TRD6_MYCCL|nr:EF-hand domain-containing protein [Mycena chlorophos]